MNTQITAINFNNQEVTFRRDEEGRVNMNDIHRASGEVNKTPKDFLRTAKSKALVAKTERLIGQKCLIKTAGRYGSTWAHEDVVLGYAAWIDADFYAAVLEAFTHAVGGD